MWKVNLRFPDASSLAAFVLLYNILDMEEDPSTFSLKGLLAEDLMMIACTGYGADPINVTPDGGFLMESHAGSSITQPPVL